MVKWKKIVAENCSKSSEADIKHIKGIIQDTELARNEELQEFKKNKRVISTVLSEWPCLRYGKYVSERGTNEMYICFPRHSILQ